MFLSSLPVITPPPQHILATSHTAHHLHQGYSQHAHEHHSGQHHRSRREPKQTPPHKANALSLIALSQAEELIEHRKNAIATFGYSWIKPAGCAKTMLGRREEELEREEVERQIREAEEAEMRGNAEFDEGQPEEIDEADGQRDLDDDVPDADADQTNLDDEDDDVMGEGNETGFTMGGTHDGEDTGFITGDHEGELDVSAMEQEELMMGGDLDGDIPSAEQSRLEYDDDDADGGEWQHTDSEEEIDDSSVVIGPPSHGRVRQARTSAIPPNIGEDSEMMDMDITRASIDASAAAAVRGSYRAQRAVSGNAFFTPSQPSPAGTSTLAHPTMFPPSSSGVRSTSTSGRRLWFSRSTSNPIPQPSPSGLTPENTSSQAAHALPAPQRPTRPPNFWTRARDAGSNLFSSSAASTPSNTAAHSASSTVNANNLTTPAPTGSAGGATTAAVRANQPTTPGVAEGSSPQNYNPGRGGANNTYRQLTPSEMVQYQRHIRMEEERAIRRRQMFMGAGAGAGAGVGTGTGIGDGIGNAGGGGRGRGDGPSGPQTPSGAGDLDLDSPYGAFGAAQAAQRRGARGGGGGGD